MATATKLFRSSKKRVIAGVCAGLAKRFDMDPVWMRIIFIAALILAGATFWLYIILWIIVPMSKTQ